MITLCTGTTSGTVLITAAFEQLARTATTWGVVNHAFDRRIFWGILLAETQKQDSSLVRANKDKGT